MLLRSIFIFIYLATSSVLFGQLTIYGTPEPVDSLNSASSENYLYLDKQGGRIFFTRENHPQNIAGSTDKGDVWMSVKEGEEWLQPLLLPFNDENFTSPIGFTSNNGFFLYNKVKFEKGIHVGEVWACDANFENAQKIEIPALRSTSPIQSGSISQDGQFLILSLETNIGYGVEDLYVCTLGGDGRWSAPRNLGYRINTAFQEITPFLAADNKTLFFSTNARDSKGSFDVYMSVRLDDTWRNWSEPVNLEDINTAGGESAFGFLPEEEYGYFVSIRDSDGYGDIRRVRISAEIEEVAPIDTIQEMVVKEVVLPSVVFKVIDIKTDETIEASGKAVDGKGDTVNLSDGENFTKILASGSPASYRVEFRSPGYLKDYFIVQPEHFGVDTDSLVTIGLEPLSAGNTITLKNVLFYRGTANFVEGSEGELDLIVEMMNENPEIRILLKGHTDNQGDADLNLQLSEERIKSVTDYLVSQGIDSGRVQGKGFGGSQPIASNLSESSRRLNRRVEFEIIAD